MSKSSMILFYTACGGSYGFGHLKRCINLIDAGKDSFNACIYLRRNDNAATSCTEQLHGSYHFIEHLEDADHIDLIVSDVRNTKQKEMIRLGQMAPVIAIDDCGAGRLYAHVTIYALPTVEGFKGNYSGSAYIVLDHRLRNISNHRQPVDQKNDRIVVSFGGSDPHNLTDYITDVLNAIGIKPVIVRGPFFHHPPPRGNCEVVDNPRNPYEIIDHSRILITSFGITMYEALYLGVPVILFNHSGYHWRLARKLPVTNLGYHGGVEKQELTQNLNNLISQREILQQRASENRSIVDGNGTQRILSIIKNTVHARRKDCLFHHRNYRVVRRNGDYTILKCRRCNDLFLFELRVKDQIYEEKEYFLSEYKKQYGRTYVEDRENIVRFSERRMDTIERCWKKSMRREQSRWGGEGPRSSQRKSGENTGKLLDVGCALGYFLDVARGRGWETLGLEISPFAARWARSNLKLDVINGSYTEVEFSPESFDAVTLFFVAEHFKDVEKVIERVYGILKKGGLIAFSLPNRGGIRYLIDREGYFETHPRDHYFDTSVKNFTRFIKGFGFEKKQLRITGIHPERFFQKIGIKKEIALLWRFYTYLAQILKLGDTFEYYGFKK